MTNDKNKINPDPQLRRVLGDTKIVADDNLSFRIMQQIETESALARKRGASTPIRSIVTILLLIFILITFCTASLYFKIDWLPQIKEQIVFYVIISISSILSFLACILAIDAKLKSK